LTTSLRCFNLDIGNRMYCDLCLYFNVPDECSLHGGRLTAEQKLKGCEGFIERPLRICGSPGCCGLSGLPAAEFFEESEEAESDRQLQSK